MSIGGLMVVPLVLMLYVGGPGCTDPIQSLRYPIVDDGSCTYASSTSVTLTMQDSFGDGGMETLLC